MGRAAPAPRQLHTARNAKQYMDISLASWHRKGLEVWFDYTERISETEFVIHDTSGPWVCATVAPELLIELYAGTKSLLDLDWV